MPESTAAIADRRPTRRLLPTAAALTSVFIALAISIVVAGFIYISHQQAALNQLRDEGRDMRRARQAAMEVDSAVLNALASADGTTDPMAYLKATEKLDSHPDTHFPAEIVRGLDRVAIAQLLQSLKVGWRTVMAELNIGQLEQARVTYERLGIRDAMHDLVGSIFARLAVSDETYAEAQATTEFALNVVLAAQIIAGLFCIAAFTFAARQSAREARARAKAVVAANSSRDQVERLFEMTDMLQSAGDHTDANAVLRSAASDLLPGFGGALYVFNNSRDRLVLSSQWGERREGDVAAETIALTQCWALKRGKPHINRANGEKLCCDHHMTSDVALEIPMIARGEILGLLEIRAYGHDAETRLNAVAGIGAALADAMSLALANIGLREKLRSQALRDPLTGLYNRRYMEDALDRFVRLADREKRDFSVIMIDLDHFKKLNDEYGHAKGDAVLRAAAAAITSQMRETDVPCRYGGEELIVLLPDCSLDDAAAKAEVIRAGIAALSEPDGAQVSASLGVATVPVTSSSAKDLLAHADAALYLAKNAGRNRVVRASPKLTVPEGRSETRRIAAE